MASSCEPSPWGDFFVGYERKSSSEHELGLAARADELKGVVRTLFTTRSSSAEKLLLLVDAVQHLGVDRHFQEEISTALAQIHGSEFIKSSGDLREVALGFRLLREHGHRVSPDVFDKFKGEDGRFSKDVTNDPRGLLSLHDASHLLVDGETTLEEAIVFTRHHLKLIKGSLHSPLAEQVERSLHIPLPRTFNRVETLHFIRECTKEEGRHNPDLLELAKLDFNLLQHLHLKEIKAITRWWKDLTARIGLSYARDRIVECYTWSYAVFYEDLGFAPIRMILTKQMVLLTIMDDTYDSYATIEECRQLHQAMRRWDASAVSLVPDYLKKFYTEFLRNFEEFEGEMAASDRYRIAYIKQQFINQSGYFLQEAEWSHQNHNPTFQDQLNLSSMSITVPTLCMGFMAFMCDGVDKEALDWAATFPDVIMATARIARLMNDITSLKRGKCKGDVASSVECYMKEHGVTSEVAIAKIDLLLEDEWKTMNRSASLIQDHPMLRDAVKRVISFAVSMTFFYSDRTDSFTFCARLENTIRALFVEPIST